MIRILFLAANPVDQARLRVRNEFNGVRQVLDATAERDRFQLIPEFDATPDELQDLLTRHQPQIVHFSGHGTAAGLLFADQAGRGQLVAPQTLRDLFGSFNETVRCVVLNACSSEEQAQAIAGVVDAVVGMGDVVSDDGALAFATAFYRALMSDATLATAMERARNQIDLAGLAEVDTPQLRAERIDAEQVRAVDWDVPAPAEPTGTVQTINTGGGSNIGGGVTTGGNFAGRDYIGEQHIHYHGEAPPATSPAQSTTPRGIFGLYPFNQHFFGRDDELATLHNLLQNEPNVSICPTITGMGGLGKTQLAAHYAHAHIADYRDGIFWITAADLNNIRPQLADFCVALNLPVADPQRTGDLTEQKISAFKAYLDAHPQALLIFDNVEEPDHLRTRQIGIGFTALTLGGKVLVTTRRRKLPGDHFAELALERLLPAPARQILTTARPDLATDPDLDRLCEQFGYLPLMLNLAAAALAKRGGAIAGYLSKLQEWGIDTLHDRARISLDDYHTSLTAVLQEQWAMLTSEDARLLLRVAGQLPEAEVIPTARLGLLAGLRDVDEWECPLRDGVEELEGVSLVEIVDKEGVRLHPLVRDFAASLTPIAEQEAFCNDCAQRLADAYCNGIDGLIRLGHEYEQRGISALVVDFITAIELSQSPVPTLYSRLRMLRREAHHLQAMPAKRRAPQLWQQLLPYTGCTTATTATLQLAHLLQQTFHWVPHWGHSRQSPAVEQTLTGHEGVVLGVAVVDANRIVSASNDRTLKVWNLQTGAVEQTLASHEGFVLGMAVVDANRIVCISSDWTLKIWNLQSGKVEQTLAGHESYVLGVAVMDANRIVSTSDDRTLKIWNLQSGEVEQTLTGHEDSVRCVAVVDANCIVSTSDDCTLKIWNLQSGEVEQTLTGHKASVNGVAVVNANRIVSASEDCTLKVWDLQTGQVEQTLTGHEGGVRDVGVVDANRIVSTSYDRTLRVWNLQSGEVEQTFTGHESLIRGVAVVDANRIVSASDDHTLKIWDLQSGEAEQTLTGHIYFVDGVAVVDANRIVSASSDRTLKIWNLQSGQAEQTLTGHEASVNGVAVVDANRIVSVSSDRTLKIWNLQTGHAEQTLAVHEDYVNGVAVVDANRIISASDDRTLKVWNLQTSQLEQTLTGHKSYVKDVAVVDANRIVSASDDCTLNLWNLYTGQIEQTLTGHESAVNGVAVTDANRIISVSSDRTLKVWDLQTGQVITSIGLDSALTCVAVTRQNGRTLVVAGDAGGALYCLELVEPVGE